MCSFCWQKCGPRPRLFLRLDILSTFKGTHTLIFTYVPYIVTSLHDEPANSNREKRSVAHAFVLPICLLFWWFYLLSVWWLGKYCYVKIRLYGTIVAALVRTKSNGRFVKKKKISRNGLGIFHNSANDRDRWALLIFCCQSNIWCLIMSTQPTLCPTNAHTNEKETVYLMTSAHPTSGPHNLFSNFHHDEWTSFLITKLPKNKRKIFPKVLKVHINQSQFSLYSTSPRNQYKLKP